MSNIIELDDVIKIYRRGSEQVRALDGISLSIEQGDYLSIVGPSGSGKTTLLNLIGCIDKPTTGSINIEGVETGPLKDGELAGIRSATIGFVFQQFFLLPTLTALENVTVPGVFARRNGRRLAPKARELLGMVGLDDRADHLPSELSGGEMQRVAIARALVNDPKILLADEPTGNLDSKSAEEISAVLEGLSSNGLTIVLVTHNVDLAASSNRTVHLMDGKIEE